MESERIIRELIGLVYDAAARSELWQTFLFRFGDVLNSRMNTFYVHDRRGHSDKVSIAIGIDPAAQRDYETYYAPKNIFHIKGRHLFVPGAVFTSEMMCPDRREVLKSEFYNDFVQPLKLSLEGLNAIVFKQHDLIGILGSIREKGGRKFGENEVMIVQALLPHIQRAIQFHLRMSRFEQTEKATLEALNRWAMGVVVLDHRGQLLLMNRTAELIFKQTDGLTLGRDGFRAAVPEETAALKKSIHDAIRTSAVQPSTSKRTMVISRPSMKRKFEIFVSPLSSRFDLFAGTHGSAVIFVNDPDMEESATDQVLLRNFYGLTNAEIQVASLLLEGKTLKEIADQLHVSYETPRIHLKHIFEKTRTRRQSELMRLLINSLAHLHSPSK